MSTTPLVSLIVCVYNAGDYLRPSIESLLAQTYRNIEIVIVDDGSTDGCVETVRGITDARIRIIRQVNQGKPAAMNVALEAMRGEFYALNDADDLSHPRRIEWLVKCMQENPTVAAVYSGHELILDGRHLAPVSAGKTVEECQSDISVFRMPAHDPTGMYRMSMVGHLRYNAALPIVEGFDYILRVGEMFPMMVAGACLYSYRIHMESVTKRNPARRDHLVREVLRLACERRGLHFQTTFPPSSLAFNGDNKDLDNNLAAHFMESAVDLRSSGRYADAIRTGLACARLQPRDPHYYKALLYSVLPGAIRRVLRPSERRRRVAGPAPLIDDGRAQPAR